MAKKLIMVFTAILILVISIFVLINLASTNGSSDTVETNISTKYISPVGSLIRPQSGEESDTVFIPDDVLVESAGELILTVQGDMVEVRVKDMPPTANAVEINLSFNPEQLTPSDITIFEDILDTSLVSSIDKQTGIISYTAGRLNNNIEVPSEEVTLFKFKVRKLTESTTSIRAVDVNNQKQTKYFDEENKLYRFEFITNVTL